MKHCPNRDCPHLLRHGAFNEFQDWVEVCTDCGGPLESGEPPEIPRPGFRELVTVYQAASPIQAQIIRSRLEAEGIPVHVKGDMLAGAVGELPANVLYVEVQVPPESAERAREIALEVEREAQ